MATTKETISKVLYQQKLQIEKLEQRISKEFDYHDLKWMTRLNEIWMNRKIYQLESSWKVEYTALKKRVERRGIKVIELEDELKFSIS